MLLWWQDVDASTIARARSSTTLRILVPVLKHRLPLLCLLIWLLLQDVFLRPSLPGLSFPQCPHSLRVDVHHVPHVGAQLSTCPCLQMSL